MRIPKFKKSGLHTMKDKKTGNPCSYNCVGKYLKKEIVSASALIGHSNPDFYLKASVIVFFGFFFAVATVFAQKKTLLSRPYHSQINRGPVRQFLENLNANSGIVIEYASNSVDGNRIVELNGAESTIGALLSKVLEGQHIKLLEKNNKLLLIKSSTVIDTDELIPVFIFYGFVKAGISREPLIGATVFDEISQKGTATNSYGYFSLSLSDGRHKVEISHVGYNSSSIELTLKNNTRADIELAVSHEREIMQEVVVPAVDDVVRSRSAKITSGENENYNYLFGENDPLRSAYLLPGVRNIPVSFSGMFVRGGDPGENLFLMDGNVVFNPTHMLGALSIVNQTSMKSMQLYKSDFPSKFGGATSSVVDIYTKDGNMNHWEGEANAGTLSGSFTIEGPISKNKTAVMASVRHSWNSPVLKLSQKDITPDFYDVHFKATQLLNANNKLMLNFYNGHDEVAQSTGNTDNLNKWGNLIGSLVWNKVIGARSFISTSVNMSRYDNLGAFKYTLYNEDDDIEEDDDDELEAGSLGTFTSTEQYNIKSQAEIYLNYKTKLNLGAQLAHTIIKPFETKFSEEIDEDERHYVSMKHLPYDLLSGYGEIEVRPFRKLFLRPGLHFSAYQFNDYRFYSFEPRLFASYKTAKNQHVFASYNKMTQYLHLITNPFLGANTDTWMPSTLKLKPEESTSYDLGYEYNHPGNIKMSVEGYWKEWKNVTNFAEGGSYLAANDAWEQNINTGKGWAYGTEWLLQKTNGKVTFLAAYTLAWSWRRFDDINNGEKFPYKYDRRHSVNAAAGYKLSPNLDFSALWTFSTGDAFSLPDHIYPDFDQANLVTNPNDFLKDFRFVYEYAQNNRYRTSPYHRLDAAINYHTKKEKKNTLMITGGVYNIYSSADEYVYEMKGSVTNKSMMAENGYKTFGMTPYVSLTFKF